MSAPPLRVMLVDDHQVVRDGIKLLLADTPDVVVCAEAASAREAVAIAARALPDVIVMDVRLSDGSGIEATRDIRAARPHTAVLMLTSFADDEALFASIMAGPPAMSSSRSRARSCCGPSGPSGPARTCSTRRSPRGSSSGCARASIC
jgi:DNA-binding NarL/FixJ family response regulator